MRYIVSNKLDRPRVIIGHCGHCGIESADELDEERGNLIGGGIGDELSPDEVDPDELKRGIGVEQEHIKNNKYLDDKLKDEIARDIALDHLAEHSMYYSFLEVMENLMTKFKGKEEEVLNQLRKISDATEE